jgi:hypothetical protein
MLEAANPANRSPVNRTQYADLFVGETFFRHPIREAHFPTVHPMQKNV